MKKVNVLLCDHQLLVKEAWHILFNKQDKFAIAGEASTTDEAITQAEELKPDVIMFEIDMPGIDWLEAIQKIVKVHPPVKILIVSVIKETSSLIAALRNGASGYVTKNDSAEEVFKALEHIIKGHKYVGDELNEVLIEAVTHPSDNGKNEATGKLDKLTPAEKKVIGFLLQGISSRQIAQELNISTRTVEVHRYHILKKMGQPNTLALVSFLNRNKIMIEN